MLLGSTIIRGNVMSSSCQSIMRHLYYRVRIILSILLVMVVLYFVTLSVHGPTSIDLPLHSRSNFLRILTGNSSKTLPTLWTNRSSVDMPDNISSLYSISDSTLCYKYNPHLLIWIYSASLNSERRKAVRATWGNVTQYLPMRVVVVFSLAEVRRDYQQKTIEAEQLQYGDIVQDKTFRDAYRNLSRKGESMLKWTTAYCSGIKLLLKTDDDSFLIPKRVASWMKAFEHRNAWPLNSILGNVFKSPQPYRNSSKWRVTYEEWPHDTWARRACSGSGYFISGDAVPKLNNLIGKAPYVWIEDMYITGILASHAGLNHISNSAYHHLIYRKNKTRTAVRYSRSVFIIGNIPTTAETYSFWKLVGHLTPGYNVKWHHCVYSCPDS